MGVLTEGTAQTTPATQANLDAWIGNLGVPFTWTLDATSPSGGLENWFGEGRDTYLIVDLQTMKVVDIVTGGDHAKALADLQALLAK
jgi:hypothetical protein